MADLSFKLLDWQRTVLSDKTRFKVVVAGRRCGKSRLAATLLLIKGLECPSGSHVMYVAPTQGQARTIIWQMLLDLGYGVITGSHVNNMEVFLPNGVTIYIRGADRPDTLRGGDLYYIVIDEYADIKPIVWEQVLRASLARHKGGALFIGCVTKDTLIIGENGIEEIGASPIGYTQENKMIYGIGGFHKAEDRYGNQLMKTIKIRTKAGLELEATPNHRILTPNGWARMDSLKNGTATFMQIGQKVFGNEICELDFAYFLGLYLAEGNSELNIYRVTITSGDECIHEFLSSKFGFKRYDKFHSRLNSKKFIENLLLWFPDAGSVRAPQKKLNCKVLGLAKEQMRKFISGYFDGDGTIASGNSHGKPKQQICCVTSSKELAKQIQLLLMNMGYRVARSSRITPVTKLVKVESIGHRLEITGESAFKFANEIGFFIKRKQDNAKNWVIGNGHHYWFKRSDFGVLTSKEGYLGRVNKITRSKLDKIDKDLKYDRSMIADEIYSVSESENETFDFVIPDTHSYFSNGLISHNTPKGRNHFYEIYSDGQEEKDAEWKSWHFTTADNNLIDPKEIEAAKRTLSSFSFKQEYLASFDNAGTDLFKETWLKYGEEPKVGSWYIAIDLAGFEAIQTQAANSKKRLDETAIAVVKVTDEGKWWIKKIEHGRWDVRETAVRILKNIRDVKPLGIGIEKGALMNAVLPYLSDLQRKNNIYAHIVPLTHGNRTKHDRIIWSLQGMFEHGRIILNSDEDFDDFKDQLLMYPTKGVHDDLPDSLSYINQMVTTIYMDDNEDEEWAPIDIIAGL